MRLDLFSELDHAGGIADEDDAFQNVVIEIVFAVLLAFLIDFSNKAIFPYFLNSERAVCLSYLVKIKS